MKNEVDASKSLEEFFETAKIGAAKAEKSVGTLLEELDDELANNPKPIVAAINSLLYRLGNLILAEHEAQYSECRKPPYREKKWHDSPAWQAALYIMALGDTANEQYERYPCSSDKKLLAGVIQKARSVVLRTILGKIFNDSPAMIQVGMSCHPLIEPLIAWLGQAENQEVSDQEMKLIDKFLRSLMLQMIGDNGFNNLLKGAIFRTELAKTFAKALDREAECQLREKIINLNLIEIVPWLVDSLWSLADAAEESKLWGLINHPQNDTSIADLAKAAPPTYQRARHWAIFCELWPKWVEAKMADQI